MLTPWEVFRHFFKFRSSGSNRTCSNVVYKLRYISIPVCEPSSWISLVKTRSPVPITRLQLQGYDSGLAFSMPSCSCQLIDTAVFLVMVYIFTLCHIQLTCEMIFQQLVKFHLQYCYIHMRHNISSLFFRTPSSVFSDILFFFCKIHQINQNTINKY